MSRVGLTASLQTNLLSLQNIAKQGDAVQNRLSTGLKVSSAIENPSSFYTASSLNNRAADLTALLDSMGQAVTNLKNVSAVIDKASAFLEQAKAVALSALESGPADPVAPDVPLKPEITSSKLTNLMAAAGISGVVVSSAAELKDALNNASSGETIVVWGEVNLDDTVLTLKPGVKLSGAEGVLREMGAEDEYAVSAKDRARLNMNFDNSSADVSKGALVLNSDSELSDITMNFRTNLKMDMMSSEGGKRIVIKNINVNMDVDVKDVNGMFYGANGAEIYLEGTNNISYNKRQGYYLSWYLFGGKYNTYIHQAADSTLNVEGSVVAFRGGKSDLYGTVNASDSITNFIYSHTANVYGTVNISNFSHESLTANAPTLNLLRGSAFNVIDSPSVIKLSINKLNWEEGAVVNSILGSSLISWSSEGGGNYIGEVTINRDNDLDDISSTWKRTNSVIAEPPRSAFALGSDEETKDYSAASNRYNEILRQYQQMIKDGFYRGNNLLLGQSQVVNFNEDRSSGITIKGYDISLGALNLQQINWAGPKNIDTSLSLLEEAIATLRGVSSDFGNYYSIVTNRERFTENLINVLTAGADKLTLADMNAESANMLALQTAQQLAVNSLSLASKAAQSVFKLF